MFNQAVDQNRTFLAKIQSKLDEAVYLYTVTLRAVWSLSCKRELGEMEVINSTLILY